MNKIVFLDIDGVLNSTAWFKERGKPTGKTYADDLAFYSDPGCIARLNLITEVTGAQIVLSSSWRHAAEWEKTAAILTERRGMTGHMIGRTPREDEQDHRVFKRYQRRNPTSQDHYPRGYEIQQWLDANPPCSFVILDDDDDMEHLGYRLVQTSFETGGLQLGHVRRAIVMLSQ